MKKQVLTFQGFIHKTVSTDRLLSILLTKKYTLFSVRTSSFRICKWAERSDNPPLHITWSVMCNLKISSYILHDLYKWANYLFSLNTSHLIWACCVFYASMKFCAVIFMCLNTINKCVQVLSCQHYLNAQHTFSESNTAELQQKKTTFHIRFYKFYLETNFDTQKWFRTEQE